MININKYITYLCSSDSLHSRASWGCADRYDWSQLSSIATILPNIRAFLRNSRKLILQTLTRSFRWSHVRSCGTQSDPSFLNPNSVSIRETLAWLISNSFANWSSVHDLLSLINSIKASCLSSSVAVLGLPSTGHLPVYVRLPVLKSS